MAKRHKGQNNRVKPAQARRRPQDAQPTITLAERAAMRKPAVRYGVPFIVLEDPEKNTFVYQRGTWLPYGDSIAVCRANGQVKELPQKVNNMIRYEVRLPD